MKKPKKSKAGSAKKTIDRTALRSVAGGAHKKTTTKKTSKKSDFE